MNKLSDCLVAVAGVALLSARLSAQVTPGPGQQPIDFTTSPPAPGIALNAYSGDVSVSGATLFRDFFLTAASTNDYIDADGDGCQGFAPGGGCPTVDGLSSIFQNTLTNHTFWTFAYRSVGSVNGISEYVDSQLLSITPLSVPSDGVFNQYRFVNTTVIQTPAGNRCNASGAPFCPDAVQPVTAAVLDVPTTWATFFGNPAAAAWNLKPHVDGYGQNPIFSNTGWNSILASLTRGTFSLNQNFAAPNANTVYDTQVCFAPIGILTNRGTGKVDVRYTELQHLFATGRLPNGENLVGGTRSAGSGTRNGCMNSLGIDPSWGRGDNVGNEVNNSEVAKIGVVHQPTNSEGSGQLELIAQNDRLAVTYSGLAGGSAAAADRAGGLYEILNVCKDIDGDGDGLPDSNCTPHAATLDDGAGNDVSGANNGFVRPTIDTMLDNDDPTTGYQIGGPETFVTRGDPLANDFDFNSDGDSLDLGEAHDPAHAGNLPMTGSLPTAAYLKNIMVSMANFTSAPADVANLGMPGEYLGKNFLPLASLDALQQAVPADDPTKFVAAPTNQTLQNYVRANSEFTLTRPIGPFGVVNTAGRVPQRSASADAFGIPYVYADGSTGKYSDGSTNNRYYYFDAALTLQFVTQANNLSQRNRISCDFNYDNHRDVADIDKMVTAMFDPRNFEKGVDNPGDAVPPKNGSLAINAAIAEILGDADGDGNFDKEDLRYFADGLGIYPTYTGSLNRKEAAIAIDAAIVAHAPAQDYLANPIANPRSWLPWASTRQFMVVPPAAPGGNPKWELPPSVDAPAAEFLATHKTYKNGDFRADVAGTTVLNGGVGSRLPWLATSPVRTAPTPGAAPTGWDGRVDAKDIDYVVQNILKVSGLASWSDVNKAIKIDLSCDMNGDLVVDCDDVKELVEVILETQFGDRNLDGTVDAVDEPQGLFPRSGGWADGDFNCDGQVTQADHDIWQTNSASCTGVPGDFNGDCRVNATDLSVLRACRTAPGVAYNPLSLPIGCTLTPTGGHIGADFDQDGDVDQNDFGSFQRCYSGAQVQNNLNCAN